MFLIITLAFCPGRSRFFCRYSKSGCARSNRSLGHNPDLVGKSGHPGIGSGSVHGIVGGTTEGGRSFPDPTCI